MASQPHPLTVNIIPPTANGGEAIFTGWMQSRQTTGFTPVAVETMLDVPTLSPTRERTPGTALGATPPPAGRRKHVIVPDFDPSSAESQSPGCSATARRHAGQSAIASIRSS